jgi:GNAT superfamily N-acetyltransferase
MNTPIFRRFDGANDLRKMQALVQALWPAGGRFHIGDLAWQRSGCGGGAETQWRTALWETEAGVIGWGWLHLPGHLYVAARPTNPEVVQEVLAWFEREAEDDELSVDVLDTETHLTSALRARGYIERESGPFGLHTRLDLARMPGKPLLPTGLKPMSMLACEDIQRRVESHRAAWHPSSMTDSKYHRVMGNWPYRRELDWMIEISDGRFVANCCVWFDEENRVGLLEPVGVDPGFRRQGLARAVCLHALHALRDLGGTQAIVTPRGDDGYPFTRPLYLGMGFEPYARTIGFTRRRDSSSPR